MPQITYASSLHEAIQNTPDWKLVPHFKSLGREIVKDGINYQIFNKKERFCPLLKRIGLIALTILFVGIPLLCSKKMRTLFFKGKETIRSAVPVELLKPTAEADIRTLTGTAGRPSTLVPYYREIDRIREADTLSPPNNWKKGLGSNEIEQTLEEFNTDLVALQNAERTTISIILFGDITEKEKKIIRIVRQYLKMVHGMHTSIQNTSLALPSDDLREKFGHTQYALSPMHFKLREQISQNSYALGFTNQDIYPGSSYASVNFLYGEALPSMATGVFSTYRLADDGKVKALIRLMKLASHEFAHMRGLNHCTDYVCGVQGINNLEEMDKSSLLFCAQDMAKICLVNNWSIKKGYQRQLQFFKQFSQKHSLPCDFTNEIALLERKIRKLEISGS
ncbi:hypothetical protein [Estrella lausannensis]|uniref:Putative membrane protein n=1 Tax=Estrella lausannensis TaxID=483423 RepID=A0A0H5DNR4_9BACT|nr:hypothetical protein [Estrella lausannensis]CRX37922.1 putative membrane protein [Estrella lausannensis]